MLMIAERDLMHCRFLVVMRARSFLLLMYSNFRLRLCSHGYRSETKV